MHTLRTARDVASLFFVAVLATTPLAAQTSTEVSFFGGVATDQLGQRSNAVGVAPSFTFAPSANVSAHLGGSATRFATNAWSVGGSASFVARDAIAPHLAFALRGAANASRLQSVGAGTYLEGELAPALELTVSRITAFAGGRLLGGSASQETALPGTGVFGPTRNSTNASRGGGGPSWGATATLFDEGERALSVSAREDRARVAGIAFTDRAVMAAVAVDGVSLTATAGTRRAPDEDDSWANGALSIPVLSAASLVLAGGRFARDRVLGTPAGGFMSAGVSLTFGRHVAPEVPTPADVPAPARGMTRLAIRAPRARTVELAGDFTNWKTIPAQRAPNGVWYADLRIAAGRYRYAFRVNGSEWRVPDGATAVDDGFGGKSAWLDVR